MVALVRRMRGQSAVRASHPTHAPEWTADADWADAGPASEWLVRLGQRLARSGHRGEAQRAFLAAIELDPRNPEAWLWRAGTADGPADALGCLEQVLRLEPGNVRAQRGLEAVRAEVARSQRLCSTAADGLDRPVATRAPYAPGALAAARRTFWSLTLVASLGLATLPTAADSGPAVQVRAPAGSDVALERPLPPAAPGETGGGSAIEPGPSESFTADTPGEAPAPAPSTLATADSATIVDQEPLPSDAIPREDRNPPTGSALTRTDHPADPDRAGRGTEPVGPPSQAVTSPPLTAISAGQPAASGSMPESSSSASQPGATVDRPGVSSARSEANTLLGPEPRSERTRLSSLLAADGAATEADAARRSTEAQPDRGGPEPRLPDPGQATAVPSVAPATAPHPEPIAATAERPSFVLNRLRQQDPQQYRNMSLSEFRVWAGAACGAASFATLVNALDPGRKMTVGQAVELLTARELLSPRRGLLRREDFGDVARALNEVTGRDDAAHPVNLRSPDQVRTHFGTGGGPIMFTGPSTSVWGVPHIYVATGATNAGLQILDSSDAGRTFLTWPEWQTQTGTPGQGAGVALKSSE